MRQPQHTIATPARGTYGRLPSVHARAGADHVGASILQTPGGVQDELARINTDFDLFGHDFDLAVGNLGPRPFADARSQALADLHDHVWQPLLATWRAWYADNSSWWGNLWWNHAPTGEQYAKQLVEIRAKAKELGMSLTSPTPAKFGPSVLFDPEHNLVDDAAEAARKAAQAAAGVGDALKYAGIAAVVVAGLLLVPQLGGKSG